MKKKDIFLNSQLYLNEKNKNAEWVVLLHGLGCNSKIWYKQLRTYKRHFNVLTIDMPGHPPNQPFPEWDKSYSFQLCAQMIKEVLDFHKIKRAHFVGISLGSVIIHEYIKHYPQMVSSAVFGGVIIRFSYLAYFLLWFGILTKNFLPYMTQYKLFAWIMMPRKSHQPSRNMFTKEAAKMGREQFLKWFDLSQSVRSTSVGVENSSIPKLYLTGDEDHLFLKVLKQYVLQNAKSRLVVLENCGHVCNVDKSSEFNDFSIQFIQEHSAAVKEKVKTSGDNKVFKETV